MGSVWVAEHQTLRMQVAVKFMAEKLTEDREYVERFAREAMSSAQIKSPHVVQVFDHGVADGTPYIVMELLEGEDLRTRLARTGPLPLREAALIIVQLARALSKAHAAGIVHRDIKPDNIFLLEHDGEIFVKILDFGVAKHAAQDTEFGMTGTGAMVGTPHYMSPEQILSARRVDHRADLWSLGIVMYRALTGSVPFQGETLGAVCVAIERAQFLPPSQRRADISLSLDSWFARALTRDPDYRFQTAKEMAEAFVSAADDGAHTAAAFRRPQVSLSGAQPSFPSPPSLPSLPSLPPGFSEPPPAPSPSNPWGTNPTNPAMSLGNAHRVSSTGLPATRVQMPSIPAPALPFPGAIPSAPPPANPPAWQVSGAANQPVPHQTFPGASVTHAEKGGTSRKAVIAVVSVSLSIMTVILVLATVLVLRGPAEPVPAAQPATPAAPTLPVTATPLPDPTTVAPVASTAPVEAAAGGDTAKASPTTKATTTATATTKPRRDRGF